MSEIYQVSLTERIECNKFTTRNTWGNVGRTEGKEVKYDVIPVKSEHWERLIGGGK